MLSDGRQIVPSEATTITRLTNLIPIHSRFRMILLANRPGFPFLGNDFYTHISAAFALHPVANPDPHSEIRLLRSFGPSLDKDILEKLVKAFDLLREMADEGTLMYPYSTRELVQIVRQLEISVRNHGAGNGSNVARMYLSEALRNVLDFDAWDPQVVSTVVNVFASFGLPIIIAYGGDVDGVVGENGKIRQTKNAMKLSVGKRVVSSWNTSVLPLRVRRWF
jgi:hypothetical protein